MANLLPIIVGTKQETLLHSLVLWFVVEQQ